MNLFNEFAKDLRVILEDLAAGGDLPAGLDTSKVTVEPPREASHGDLSTNAALVLSKQAGRKPREIAELLAGRLRALPDVTSVEIAGPGFVNLRLSDDTWRQRVGDILVAGITYGNGSIGAGIAVNVEYVSANPTGPLHAAHARGAVVGDALASLLEKAGYTVTREY
jgi:arginyl-tRNA synthetase